MGKKNKKIEPTFDFLLKDFESDPDPKVVMIDVGKNLKTIQQYIIELPKNIQIHHPYIVFIIFVYLKGFKFYGRDEKVAWTIPIKYKGTPFILTHRKFGFRIISNSNESQEMGVEAMTKVKTSFPYAETLFEPFVKQKLNEGKITLRNQYLDIKNRYLFFRKKAISEFKKAKKGKVIKTESTNEFFGQSSKVISYYNTNFKHLSAANNYATAMLDSYYCLIEHTFVLLLPFLKHIQSGKISLEEFIGQNWKYKLKLVIPLANDTEALQLFERLDKIKEDLRNPLTHGYFLKDGNSFYVHVPNLGAIPMNLSKKNNHLQYGFFVIHDLTFEKICKCFDDFFKFLKNRKSTKFGMLFIEQGLEVAFDKHSCEMYQSTMESIRLFKEFIRYEQMEQDNAGNMDW